MRAAAIVGLSLALSGCLAVDVAPTRVAIDGPLCNAGSHPAQIAQLFFGRNIGTELGVSEAAWQAFVDEEITPRFPEGLTVLDAAGQWRGQSGMIGREPSKVVMIVLDGEPDERARLDAVRQAYMARFSQEAVLLVEQPACVGF